MLAGLCPVKRDLLRRKLLVVEPERDPVGMLHRSLQHRGRQDDRIVVVGDEHVLAGGHSIGEILERPHGGRERFHPRGREGVAKGQPLLVHLVLHRGPENDTLRSRGQLNDLVKGEVLGHAGIEVWQFSFLAPRGQRRRSDRHHPPDGPFDADTPPRGVVDRLMEGQGRGAPS